MHSAQPVQWSLIHFTAGHEFYPLVIHQINRVYFQLVCLPRGPGVWFPVRAVTQSHDRDRVNSCKWTSPSLQWGLSCRLSRASGSVSVECTSAVRFFLSFFVYRVSDV